MYPTKEEVREIKKTKKYRRVPVVKEIFSDNYTPVSVIRKLRKASKHCYLLESATQDEQWGRYSFLGYDPRMEITCTDGNLTIKTISKEKEEIRQEKTKHPKECLRKILADNKSPKMKNLPVFSGGLVGYFSYDYIKYSEPKLCLSSKEKDDFKDMDLMLFDEVIVFDHYRQKILLIAGVHLDDEKDKNEEDADAVDKAYDEAVRKIEKMEAQIKGKEEAVFKKLVLKTPLKPQFSEEAYAGMIQKAKQYIKEGDIFQVVLSNPLSARAEGNLLDTYRILRATNPSPYMFYFSSEDIEMAGASPETLARLDKDVASTFPLAGTRPRGKDEAEDARLIRDLLQDEKELAEHNMLVDLGRNDMGRISEIGSVKVEKYMEIEKFSRVMHIGSTVTGKIKKGSDAVDVIDAILPAGTLSGAPKFRACQIIEELEQNKRGIYGGAVGYLDFTGNLDTCIAIRLVYKKKDKICIRSGAGIVADSVPQKEYAECQNKAKAVVDAIKAAEEDF